MFVYIKNRFLVHISVDLKFTFIQKKKDPVNNFDIVYYFDICN